MDLPSRLGGSLDPITRGWAVVFTGSAARLALGFLASVLIARALGPAAFGLFVVLAAISNLAGSIADFGLSEAAVRRIAHLWADDPATSARRGQAFFWLRIGAAALVFLAGSILAGPFCALLGIPGSETLLVLTLLGVAATSASGAASTLLQATGQFARLTTVMLTNAGLTALLAALLFLTGQLTIITALVILGAATSLASFVVGRRLLPEGISLQLPDITLLRREGVELFRFGRWLWIGGMLAMLATQLDLLLANRWIEPALVGAYGLALNLAGKADVVNHSLHTVLLPAASALRGADAIRHYLRRGFLRSGLVALGLLPIFLLAGPLITTIYGPEYEPAVLLFQILLGVTVFDLMVSPVLMLAFTFDQPKLLAGADGLRAVILAMMALWLLPLYGPIGAIAARLVSRIAGALFLLVLLHRHRPSLSNQP